MSLERLIGAGRLELIVGELSWERLDREVVSGFMSHLKCIDPLLLGLEDDVVSTYLLGTTWRHVGARQIGTEGPLDILRNISRPEILIDLRALSLSNLSHQHPHTHPAAVRGSSAATETHPGFGALGDREVASRGESRTARLSRVRPQSQSVRLQAVHPCREPQCRI